MKNVSHMNVMIDVGARNNVTHIGKGSWEIFKKEMFGYIQESILLVLVKYNNFHTMLKK